MQLHIRDDGKGLHLTKICQQASERGIALNFDAWDRNSIANLIFETGLSTKDQVTEISGRGVGMTAVRKLLQEIGGEAFIVLDETNLAREPYHSFYIVLVLPVHAYLCDPGPVLKAG